MLVFFAIYARHIGIDKAGPPMSFDAELEVDSFRKTKSMETLERLSMYYAVSSDELWKYESRH